MFKDKLKGFIAGAIATTIITGSAIAAFKTIDVTMGGIKIYWDGIDKTGEMKDVNGKLVEPLIYDGTTYVPIRAMSQFAGKTVDYDTDENFQYVYLGGKPAADSISIVELDKAEKIRNGSSILTGSNAKYTLKDEKYTCQNIFHYGTIMLNGQYSKLRARAVVPYTIIGSNGVYEIIFTAVENNGEEHEIKRVELTQTEDPIDIAINVRGVENLKISSSRVSGDRATPCLIDTYFEK